MLNIKLLKDKTMPSKRRFRIVMIGLFILMAQMGCGQTGPLRLPDSSPSPTPEASSEVSNKN